MRRHLYYYTVLDQDLTAASALLRGDPSRWLPAPATETDEGFLVELYAEGALPGRIARHPVTVSLGDGFSAGERLLRSVTWRSTTAPGLFPVFEGDLELIALQTNVCQLSLFGTYRPPLSVAGGAGDAVLGHRVAEACIRRFVLDTAEHMVAV